MTSEDFNDDGSGYGTHLPFLKLLFQAFKIKSVIEFGMGNFSTKFFLFKGCKVLSIEQQEKSWFDKMTTEIKDNNWQPILNLGPAVPKEEIDKKGIVDMAFVDGHLNSRADCVNYMFYRAYLIVAHDYEYKGYNWNKILIPPYYKKIVYHSWDLQTVLFINEKILNKL